MDQIPRWQATDDLLTETARATAKLRSLGEDWTKMPLTDIKVLAKSGNQSAAAELVRRKQLNFANRGFYYDAQGNLQKGVDQATLDLERQNEKDLAEIANEIGTLG